jgi:hypothetical protein
MIPLNFEVMESSLYGREIEGTYGSCKTPCTIFEYQGWYCVQGSVNVNLATIPDEDLYDGVDVELVSDSDTFTASSPIDDLEDLIRAVDE